jgi:cyanophycin synthetase
MSSDLRPIRALKSAIQLSADKIADEGLGLDRFAVGAAMAPLSSQARDATVPTDTTGLIVEAATDLAVLNADDPACASLASRCRAKRICWVTKDPETPLAADHIASGGPLVAVAEPDGIPAICLWDGEDPAAPKPVVQLGASGRDMADGEILENMFAAAVAFGLGVPLPVISEALADMTSAGNPTGASMT